MLAKKESRLKFYRVSFASLGIILINILLYEQKKQKKQKLKITEHIKPY